MALAADRLRRASRRGRAESEAARQAARHRDLDCYIEACGIAPSARRRRARRGRRPLRGGQGARAPHRHRCTVFTGTHSHGQGHETTFAQLVAEQLGVPDRERRDRPRRHRPDPVRHGHLRLALARGRRLGDRQGDRQDRRQGQEDRRAPAGGGRGRHRVRGRQVHRRRHRQQQDLRRGRVRRLRAAQLSDRGAGAGLEETAFYDPKNFTYPGRQPHLRGRGRPGDRRGRGRELRRGRRLRRGRSTR